MGADDDDAGDLIVLYVNFELEILARDGEVEVVLLGPVVLSVFAVF